MSAFSSRIRRVPTSVRSQTRRREVSGRMREVRKFGPSLNDFYKSRIYTKAVGSRFLRGAFSIIVALITVPPAAVVAQQTQPQHGDGATIRGNVLNSAGKSVGDASVWLEQEGVLKRSWRRRRMQRVPSNLQPFHQATIYLARENQGGKVMALSFLHWLREIGKVST